MSSFSYTFFKQKTNQQKNTTKNNNKKNANKTKTHKYFKQETIPQGLFSMFLLSGLRLCWILSFPRQVFFNLMEKTTCQNTYLEK